MNKKIIVLIFSLLVLCNCDDGGAFKEPGPAASAAKKAPAVQSESIACAVVEGLEVAAAVDKTVQETTGWMVEGAQDGSQTTISMMDASTAKIEVNKVLAGDAPNTQAANLVIVFQKTADAFQACEVKYALSQCNAFKCNVIDAKFKSGKVDVENFAEEVDGKKVVSGTYSFTFEQDSIVEEKIEGTFYLTVEESKEGK